MEPPIPVGFHDFLYSLATNEGFTQFSDTPIYPMIFWVYIGVSENWGIALKMKN